jgi:hypothetical protein
MSHLSECPTRENHQHGAHGEIIPFDFGKLTLTTIVDGNGNPWWVAKEVCDGKRQFNHSLRSQAVNGVPINILRKKCAVFIRRLDQGQFFKYVAQVAVGFKAIGLGGFNQA